MRESRFIALLNLYVDQELSAAEAAELETEIAQNSSRRRTYEQYCRMHRACVALFEKERAPTPQFAKLLAAARAADEKVVAFPDAAFSAGGSVAARPAWGRTLWATGLVAAAACVAIVFVRQSPPLSVETDEPVGAQVATVEPAATPVRVAEEPVAIPQPTTAPRRSNYHTVLVAHPLLRGHDGSNDSQSLSFASDRASLEWMGRVELSPLQRVSAEDLVFDVRPLQTPESRTYRGRNSYPANVDLTAFQFQR